MILLSINIDFNHFLTGNELTEWFIEKALDFLKSVVNI